MSEYDVVIIGGGPAGLSAALVLARARRRVLVVDGGRPRNAAATHLHGYLSRDGMPPADLLAAGRTEVLGYGAGLMSGRVTSLVRHGSRRHWVLLADGTRVAARRVLVTTGLRDELPDLAGLRDRWAQDVLHCPYCHGYEVRDRRLGVLANGSGSVRYALIVRQWSDDVVYFTGTSTLTPTERTQLLARWIEPSEGPITRLVIEPDDQLAGLLLADGQVVACDALFVPPRFVPHDELLTGAGCDLDERGWVTADLEGRTSVLGLWAAGNVVDPRAQVITAAGAGSAVAIALNADLVAEDVDLAVQDLRHGINVGPGPAPAPAPKHAPTSTAAPTPTPASTPTPTPKESS
ncbi:MAG: NAD(P)/FAD-dependent oxidoreductase [Dermatophilaceae bacterium]|nr:NAD(P)/FAD-dependent oxidoreductase [Dermatophilaceae bacterium]MBP9919047.1 NAD(P)/FAD-dependent oxidoreductase [Dermatophilaceae bacterium]